MEVALLVTVAAVVMKVVLVVAVVVAKVQRWCGGNMSGDGGGSQWRWH